MDLGHVSWYGEHIIEKSVTEIDFIGLAKISQSENGFRSLFLIKPCTIIHISLVYWDEINKIGEHRDAYMSTTGWLNARKWLISGVSSCKVHFHLTRSFH